MKSQSESYQAAGVDITAGYEAVERMRSHVARTKIPGVLSDLGGFGGMFALDTASMAEPVLVSGADGVGTKLRLAFLMDRHHTVGIDCVAMCVNDIICGGAKPLFFLDYIACGKNLPARIEQIVAGVAEGCVQAGCSLVGGETAEMPGFYPEDEYDLAGFAVGVVDKEKVLTAHRVQEGDVVIALPSSGVHSNGFSLVRKIFNLDENPAVLEGYQEALEESLGDALLRPTAIYVKPVLALLEQSEVHGISHITGGGFFENMPRCLPEHLSIRLDTSVLRTPPIFQLIQTEGKIPPRDMFNTFNMGVGMVVIVPKDSEAKSLNILLKNGVDAYTIGEVVAGAGEVLL